jgi:hypothetical protein
MAERQKNKPESEAAKHIADYAEEVGIFIGSVEARVRDWSAERKQITERLLTIRDSATRLLVELGHQFEKGRRGARRGRPPGRRAAKKRGEARKVEAVAQAKRGGRAPKRQTTSTAKAAKPGRRKGEKVR